MFIISSAQNFATPEFSDELNLRNSDRVKALTCIRDSSLLEAQSNVSRVAENVTGCFKALKVSIGNPDTHNFLCENGTKQVSQAFRAALAIHKYTLGDQRVGQGFTITLKGNLYPISFLDAGNYIPQVFAVVWEEGPLYVTDVRRVFKY